MPTGEERPLLSSLVADIIAEWEQIFLPLGHMRDHRPHPTIGDDHQRAAGMDAAEQARAAILGRLRDVEATLRQRERAERLRTTEHAVTAVLARTVDLSAAVPDVLQAICQGLGWQAGVVWRLDRETNVLRCSGCWHVPGVAGPAIASITQLYAIGKGVELPGQVWANGRLEWVKHLPQRRDWQRAVIASEAGLRGALGFPITDGATFLGVLEFFSDELGQPDADLDEAFTSISSQIGHFMERCAAWQAEDKRRMEITLARRVWEAFLPDASPELPGYLIGGGTYPAEEIGGDFLDYLDLPDGSVGIAIGDAQGHGTSAALLIVQLSSYLRALALTERSVSRILALANRRLVRNVPEGYFVSLLLAQLNVATGTIVYGSAGHPAGYVLDEHGNVRLTLKSTGLLLGVDKHDSCPTGPVVTLRPGDSVLFLTDGILEAEANNGRPFGPDRALEVVRAHRHQHPDAIVRKLVSEVRAYAPDYQHDDMTAIVLKMLPE